ncbi:MAG: NUDIX domain-containing protein [Candidatus Kerfeldbacteria bacterium]|nr:NUDIX domain-containing protein [Candidatus Kerfeldbacteria bacterium]
MKTPITKGIDHIGVCVVFFCHDGNGRFIMAKRNANTRDEHGCWDVGGGGIEFGQTVEETIRKEIQEEYATHVMEYEFLGFRDVHREYNGRKTHWIALDFNVQVDPKFVKNNEPHKIEDVQWFTKDTVPSNVHSQIPLFFEKYKDQLHL